MLSNTELKELYKYLLKVGYKLRINNSVLEDLIQEALIAVLRNFKKGNIQTYSYSALKSKYIDYLKSYKQHYELNKNISVYPDIEQQIECKQLGKDWHDWPESKYKDTSLRAAKARIRMRKNYQLKKAA